MIYSYIYRHYDENNTLIYVGCTIDPKRRLRQHKKKSWFNLIKKTIYEKYEFSFEIKLIEQNIIANENPLFNINYKIKSRQKSSIETLTNGDIKAIEIWEEAGKLGK